MKFEDVITEAEYKSIRTLSYENFCVYLSRFAKLCVEEALRALPTVVTHLARQAAYVKRISDEFYDTHKDLARHKGIVAKAIESVEAENPGLSYNRILEKAAPKARRIMSNMSETELNAERQDLDIYDSRLKDI